MDFLKKHYEKVLLLVLLVLFVGLLAYLLTVIQSTKNIKDADLRLPHFEADYEKVKQTSEQFEFDKLFTKDIEWLKGGARNAANKLYTDLLSPYKAAICGYCGRVVATEYFESKQCPFCANTLNPPTAPVVEVRTGPSSTQDTDSDGIPDLAEIQNGLDPTDPKDAMQDADKDGFSNLYEYQCNTDLNKADSHPPLYQALQVTAVNRDKRDIKVNRTRTVGDRKLWEAEIVVEGRKAKIYWIGMTFKMLKLDERVYTVADIQQKIENTIVNGVEVKVDRSLVILTSNRETLEMRAGEDVYAPRQRALFDYLLSAGGCAGEIGDVLTLGNAVIGEEKYTIKSINGETLEVVLTNANGEDITITSQAQIPAAVRMPRPGDGATTAPATPAAAPVGTGNVFDPTSIAF